MSSLFAPLLAPDTAIAESEVHLVDEQLFPEELARIRHAVEKRRAEFGTGRVCARRALAILGLPPSSLPIGTGGAPAWPPGVIGSITHTSTYCAAVVKRCPPWRSVGIDAEVLQPLDRGVVDDITTEAERHWLSGIPKGERAVHATLLFSAKEAYYKLQHPLTRRFLDFQDVEIGVDAQKGTFRVRSRVDLPAQLADVQGRYVFAERKVLCSLELLLGS